MFTLVIMSFWGLYSLRISTYFQVICKAHHSTYHTHANGSVRR